MKRPRPVLLACLTSLALLGCGGASSSSAVNPGTYKGSYTRGTGSAVVELSTGNRINVSFFDSQLGAYYGTGSLSNGGFSINASPLAGGVTALASGTFAGTACNVQISGPFSVSLTAGQADYTLTTLQDGAYKPNLFSGVFSGNVVSGSTPIATLNLKVNTRGEVFATMQKNVPFAGKGSADGAGHFTVTVSEVTPSSGTNYTFTGNLYNADSNTIDATGTWADNASNTGSFALVPTQPQPVGAFFGTFGETGTAFIYDDGNQVQIELNVPGEGVLFGTGVLSNGSYDVTIGDVRARGTVSGSLPQLICSLALSGPVQVNPGMGLLYDGIRHPFSGTYNFAFTGIDAPIPVTIDEDGNGSVTVFGTTLGLQVSANGQVTTTPSGGPSISGTLYYPSSTSVTGSGATVDQTSQPGTWQATRTSR